MLRYPLSCDPPPSREFGSGVVNMKLLMKQLPGIFIHSDKNVRAEAKSLSVEVFRWIGAAMKPSMDKSLKPVQVLGGGGGANVTRALYTTVQCVYV